MLKFVIFLMAGIGLAGACVVTALSLGMDTREPIMTAAAIGAVIAIPVAWIIGNRLQE